MLGWEALRMAAAALWGHKIRSLLTILGVVIGVGSVVTVVVLGASFEDSIISQFDTIDDRTVFVSVGLDGPQNGPPNAGPFGTILTAVDRDGLAALPGVERVTASGTVAASGLAWNGTTVPFRALTGTDPDAAEVRDADAYETGGVFDAGANEMVLGWSVARQLGNGTAVTAGTDITLMRADGSNETVRVAGVLAEQHTLFGFSNTMVFVPLDRFYDVHITSPTTGASVLVYDGLTVIADSSSELNTVRDRVRVYMEERSDAARLLADGTRFFVDTADDITASISAAFDSFTLFIGAIAVVSLVVGAIGIANIMLVSVAERTKEIGIIKAIGALDRDVLWMFLLEALLVGFVGSLIGIAVGLGGGAALVKGFFADQDLTFIVPYDWLAISVLVGVGVGMIAGFLPARHATKIQPVAALAHE